MSAYEQLIAPSRSWLGRRRRALQTSATLLVVVLLAALALASWHFSSAVLVADHSAWESDVTVKAVSANEIVLSRSADTLRPGTYGLDWPAGHAIVANVLASSARTVRREMSSVRGYLQPGMKVALDSRVYAGTPREALGLRFTSVRVPGELGPLPAWLIPARKRTWVIVVHGINGDPQDGLRLARPLHRAGLPSLLITYREDLGAPASPDGLHHMGLTEWHDLQAAASYALARGANRLLLVGYSMGGAIVTQFMEHSPLASRVAGLVLDSPALDWRAILSFNANQMGLPSFAATPVEWAIGARVHADWDSLDALHHSANFHLPILLFHGTADRLVPISTSDAFARALPGWVTYYRVSKAAHVDSWNVDPALYEARLISFIRRISG